MAVIGLYIHIPFCQAKCTYCDFDTYAGLEGLYDDYTSALVREIGWSERAQVATIYLGGGTPTVLPLSHLSQVLEAAQRAFSVNGNAEVTIEANPGTVSSEKLAGLRTLGVNRLSLGAQSFDETELKLLGRIHTAVETIQAVHAARQAGFSNLNLDLIYGLPQQPSESWQTSMEQALALRPDHLSLYALSIEEGTPLAKRIAEGKLAVPDPDVAAQMYELAEATLATRAYVHYEISNWSRTEALSCQHNLTYWRNGPYLGVGAGAHSWLRGRRWGNVASPEQYVDRVLAGEHPIATEERIDASLEMSEAMIMGLRLLEEGVTFERFLDRFGVDLRQIFSSELAELAAFGVLEMDSHRLRLSERGHLLGNQVFQRFLQVPVSESRIVSPPLLFEN
jgi:oxygen-independent coproporphyrinogen-3 oxidase